jgi:thiamine-monophosphate kinase
MLDVSDGLLRDAGRLAEASGVDVDLDGSALGVFVEALRPVADALAVDAWEWVLSGGEDHGLLATFPAGRVPECFTVVGSVHPSRDGGADVLLDGHEPSSTVPGWDHFRP